MCAFAALVAFASTAPAAGASVASMEEIIAPGTGVVSGKFQFTAQAEGEANRVTITYAPFNQITVSDSAGVQPSGRCAYPNPLNTTLVTCSGSAGLRYDDAFVNLGPAADILNVRATGGVLPTLTIEAGTGDDTVNGGPGTDRLLDLGGVGILRGGAGNDTIYGQSGNDRVYGGAGNDRVEGGRGNDRVYGGLGDDFLLAGPGYDYILSGPGRDRILAGAGVNFVDGRRRIGP